MKPEERTGTRRPRNPQNRSSGAAATGRRKNAAPSKSSGTTTRKNTVPRKSAGASKRQRPASARPVATGKARTGAATASRSARTTRRSPRKTTTVTRSAPRRTVRGPEATPEVVYTPARPVSRNRFLLQMITMVAVVLAAVFVVSLFFKVEVVTVSGADLYDPWTVREASGIEEGDGLLTFSKARAGGKIRTALPYVESVMIGIKLPNTVNIMIEEADVGYVVKADDGSLWLMSASGKILEKTTATKSAGLTVINGVELDTPVGEQAQPSDVGSRDIFGETIPMVVTGQQRLDTLLEILQNLELNGVIDNVVSIEMTDFNNLELWYGDQFQVKLGDGDRIAKKIEAMAKAIEQMSQYDNGVLDVSFTTWPDKVGFVASE